MPIQKINPEDVSYIAYHCSATKTGDDRTAADITEMHKKRGFRTIGYHLVVRRDGTVEKGRDWLAKGAHEEKINDDSLAICWVGGVRDYETWEPVDNRTDEQRIVLASLATVLALNFPDAEHVGHRDIEGVDKACPCFDVKKWFESEVKPFL